MKEWVIHPDGADVARVLAEMRGLLMSAVARKRKVRLVAQDFRPRRTDRQNRFYHPAFVKVLAQWIAEQDGLDECTAQYMVTAHETLKDEFLRVPVVNDRTGELVMKPNGDPAMRTRSTTELTTTEFNQYLDRCAEFIAKWTGAPLPEPREYHEPEEPERENRPGRAA